MKGIIEGLMFVKGDEGITLEDLTNILEKNGIEIKEIIEELKKDYEDSNRGIRIEELGNKYKLVTKKEHLKYYEKLMADETSGTLSQASLETLAIIAYNQPIVRSKVEDLRGVDCSYQFRKLLLKGLIEEDGKSELPGRPILYKTTDSFLDYFGLSRIEDLPEVLLDENFEEDKNLYESKYQDE